MSTVETRIVQTVHHDFMVPTGGAGAAIAELMKARAMAEDKYLSLYGHRPDSDNWAVVISEDEYVVIRIEENRELPF